jgi:hypothetical protein
VILGFSFGVFISPFDALRRRHDVPFFDAFF